MPSGAARAHAAPLSTAFLARNRLRAPLWSWGGVHGAQPTHFQEMHRWGPSRLAVEPPSVSALLVGVSWGCPRRGLSPTFAHLLLSRRQLWVPNLSMARVLPLCPMAGGSGSGLGLAGGPIDANLGTAILGQTLIQ